MSKFWARTNRIFSRSPITDTELNQELDSIAGAFNAVEAQVGAEFLRFAGATPTLVETAEQRANGRIGVNPVFSPECVVYPQEIGYDTEQVVTSTKEIDTVYQNTSGYVRAYRLVLVNASALFSVNLNIGKTSPPTMLAGGIQTYNVLERLPVMWFLPANWYWKITTISGTPPATFTLREY